MNVDYNKHNIVKYLANNKDKDIWKKQIVFLKPIRLDKKGY